MKLIMENWRSHLNEIGDASTKPYPHGHYETDSDTVMYYFETEKHKYEVTFAFFDYSYDAPAKRWWGISYEIRDTSRELNTAETNEGKPLKVMSTVIAIIKKFIDNPELNRGILSFQFTGVPKGYNDDPDENLPSDPTSRTKLYMRYLKHHMPAGTEIGTGEYRKRGNPNIIKFTLPEDHEDGDVDVDIGDEQ